MKKILFLVSLFICIHVSAQDLKFHNGTFKIVQFTDFHYVFHSAASNAALKCIDDVLNSEKPDLIVVTGDIIYSAPADSTLQVVLNAISAHKIPFVMTFGNHDGEVGTPLPTIYDQMQKTPFCVMPDRNVTKTMDYVIPVKSSDGAKNAALLYCMDSHSHCDIKDVGGYQWLTFDQINWYRNCSEKYKSQNAGQPLPALAFFHIPLPEFNEAVANSECPFYGTRLEKSYPANINSGMFTAFKECGDVMGVFCGHDHDNDYSVMYYNILLAYGRFSGGNTEYNHLRNGARVIVLKEGKREMDSWIHVRGGEILDKTTYPNSYIKDNWETRKTEL